MTYPTDPSFYATILHSMYPESVVSDGISEQPPKRKESSSTILTQSEPKFHQPNSKAGLFRSG